MNENLNLRVFRRNPKNIIFVWNTSTLDPNICKPVVAMLLGDEQECLLTYSKFVPDAPEKFPKDIDGIIVSHANNNLDSNKAYKIKIIFGDSSNCFEIVKDVMPVNAFTIPEGPRDVSPTHMYAFDYKKQKWVPFPFDQKMSAGE